jgi:polar amino acid transport system substrate-binding protein
MFIKSSLLLFLFILTFSSHSLSSSSIKVALGEWPPYSSEHLPHGGLLPLIINRSLAYTDIKPKLFFMAWDEAYEKTLNGQYDISPGWLKTPEREKDMHFSKPISYIDLRFFHLSNIEFSWDNIEELYQQRLGLTHGYSYGEKLDSSIRQNYFATTYFESDREALIGLANNEIDIYPADAIVANYLLNKLPNTLQKKISLDEQTLNNSPIFLIRSKQQPSDFLEKFNQGLDTLKKNGEYAKILENFNVINKIGNLNFFTEDNAPTNYLGENGPAGIIVATISAMLNEIGADPEYSKIEVLPWARAYKTLELKKNTVLFALTKTEERADKFKWVGPIYRSNIILLGLKARFPKQQSPSSLTQQKVCAVKNDVGEQLWKHYSKDKNNLVLVSHPKQCAKMLALARVDLWATGKDTSRWHLQNNNLDLSLFTEVSQLKESFRYIAFSKDIDDDVITSFQKSLSYLQLSGELKQIINDELEKADDFAHKTKTGLDM